MFAFQGEYSSDMRIQSLEKYDKHARRQIHAIKIGRRMREYRLARNRWIKLAHHLLRDSGGLMPAPSSLYSRLAGRFDVAYLFAHDLAKAFHLPLYIAPYCLHWRLRKRSMLRHRSPIPGRAGDMVEA